MKQEINFYTDMKIKGFINQLFKNYFVRFKTVNNLLSTKNDGGIIFINENKENINLMVFSDNFLIFTNSWTNSYTTKKNLRKIMGYSNKGFILK